MECCKTLVISYTGMDRRDGTGGLLDSTGGEQSGDFGLYRLGRTGGLVNSTGDTYFGTPKLSDLSVQAVSSMAQETDPAEC
jgi:hypothetical protein